MNCQGLCHGFLLIHHTKIMASICEKSYPVILGMAPIISHSVETQLLIPKKAILWSSPLQDRSVLQTLTNYLPSTPEVEKKVLFYVYSWSLSQNSQKKPQILASHLRCLTTDFFFSI